MFFCKFCEISKSTFFTEHLWVTASVHHQNDLDKSACTILWSLISAEEMDVFSLLHVDSTRKKNNSNTNIVRWTGFGMAIQLHLSGIFSHAFLTSKEWSETEDSSEAFIFQRKKSIVSLKIVQGVVFSNGSDFSEAVVGRCYVKKGALGNFAKFTGKHLCQRLFIDKVGLQLY